jgi:hypothetical protein
VSYYPATLDHIAQWWVGVLAETPPLPGELLARRPDPRRGDYFRWCEGCRRWWVGAGMSHADAMMLWAALVATRALGDEVAPIAEMLTAPRVIAKSGGSAVRVVAGGAGRRMRWRDVRDYAARRADPQRWARRLVNQRAYEVRRMHPELTTEQAYVEAEARQVWRLANPGRRVHCRRMLAEHLAVLAARGD